MMVEDNQLSIRSLKPSMKTINEKVDLNRPLLDLTINEENECDLSHKLLITPSDDGTMYEEPNQLRESDEISYQLETSELRRVISNDLFDLDRDNLEALDIIDSLPLPNDSYSEGYLTSQPDTGTNTPIPQLLKNSRDSVGLNDFEAEIDWYQYLPQPEIGNSDVTRVSMNLTIAPVSNQFISEPLLIHKLTYDYDLNYQHQFLLTFRLVMTKITLFNYLLNRLKFSFNNNITIIKVRCFVVLRAWVDEFGMFDWDNELIDYGLLKLNLLNTDDDKLFSKNDVNMICQLIKHLEYHRFHHMENRTSIPEITNDTNYYNRPRNRRSLTLLTTLTHPTSNGSISTNTLPLTPNSPSLSPLNQTNSQPNLRYSRSSIYTGQESNRTNINNINNVPDESLTTHLTLVKHQIPKVLDSLFVRPLTIRTNSVDNISRSNSFKSRNRIKNKKRDSWKDHPNGEQDLFLEIKHVTSNHSSLEHSNSFSKGHIQPSLNLTLKKKEKTNSFNSAKFKAILHQLNKVMSPTSSNSSNRIISPGHTLQIKPNLSMPNLTGLGKGLLHLGKPLLLCAPLKVIANQFNILEQRLLVTITFKDLIDWPTHKSNNLPSPIVTCIDRFNLTCQWVSCTIVTTDDLLQRIQFIELLIELAKICLSEGNFNTCLQIVLGLQDGNIVRLTKSWNRINKKSKMEFDRLKALTSPLRNWKYLRNAMDQVIEFSKDTKDTVTYHPTPTLPTIPFLGLYLSDLIFNWELPTFNDKKCLINWHKLKIIAKVVDKVQRFQDLAKHSNSGQLVPDLYQRVMFLPTLPTQTIERLSKSCEP